MYFPKNKWIDFEYETDLFGSNMHIKAKGWIGDIYEREYENATVVDYVSVDLEWPAHISDKDKDAFTAEALKLAQADALEYFKVNFAY
jgi:hypothetical protein